MLICEDCGRTLHEDDLVTQKSYVSDYAGGCYEEYSTCPCGGDVEEAEMCVCCGEYFKKDELTDGICEDCLKEQMSVDNAIEAGNEAKVTVELNGFLASVFNESVIERLMLDEFEKIIDASDDGAMAAIDKAEEWCREDLLWFADWLKRKGGIK